jgi:hypothetical protein
VNRLLGIETEYGLYVEGRGVADQVMEAVDVLRSCPFPAVKGCWDYRLEDPRRDMRGFRVEHLAVDPHDAQIEREHPISLSEREVRSDHGLANGARLYNDHAHPEYATPECRRLMDLVAYDKAGERILLACAQAYQQRINATVKLYKNNTDYHGSSYGTHESYLLRRDIPFETLASTMTPFLTTRLIYAGAGKVGIENNPNPRVPYQISQRADFYMDTMNVETLYRRPIFNTRDEPHAQMRDYRRLHVICGDANMSEYATALKVGATALVLELLESGWAANLIVVDPCRDCAAHLARPRRQMAGGDRSRGDDRYRGAALLLGRRRAAVRRARRRDRLGAARVGDCAAPAGDRPRRAGRPTGLGRQTPDC